MYIIGYNKAFVGHLHSWHEYVKILMSDGAFYEAFKLLTELYEGKIRSFATQPDLLDYNGHTKFN